MDYSTPDDEFLLQAQRKAKRSFLAEEIVAAGYSPDLFTLFCEALKGSDIDLWNFEELQDCVRQFKAKYKPGDEAPPAEEEPVPAPAVSEDEYTLQAVTLPRTELSVEAVAVVVHR